ncbi:SAM-dependent methyltransferase [Spirillospora sp. CA-108201]
MYAIQRKIIEHPATRRLIDFERPMAIMLAAVLHSISDEDDPSAVVQAYTGALPPGGYLVVSHSTYPANFVSHLTTPGGPWGRSGIHPRDHASVVGLFDGLGLVGPGKLVDAPDWRPDLAAEELEAGLGTWLVGVARKEAPVSAD